MAQSQSSFAAVLAWLSGLDAGGCFLLILAGGLSFGLYVGLRIAMGKPILWSRERDLHSEHGNSGGYSGGGCYAGDDGGDDGDSGGDDGGGGDGGGGGD